MAQTPPANPATDALMREVYDAVRQDRIAGFWRRFGIWIAAAIVIGLIAFGGWLYWNHHRQTVSGETAEAAQDVLETVAAGGNPDGTKLGTLLSSDQDGYRAMGLLAKAGHMVQRGDTKGAAAIFRQMSGDESLATPYRDLATLRLVAMSFDEMKPQDIVTRLKPLAVEGNPWFGSAGEMTAIAYMKMGRKDMAGPVFAAIAKDESVPRTLRSRARQMAGLLGVDAVDVGPASEEGATTDGV